MLRTLAAARGALFLAVLLWPALVSAQFFDVLSLGTLDPVRNRVYTGTASALRLIDGRTQQFSEFATSTSPGTIAVNAITNKAYYLGTNSIVEFDGATHARIAFTLTATPTLLAVNVATNKIYGVSANGVATVIDGSTRAVTTVNVAPGATGIGINTATNKVYLAGPNMHVIDGATNVATALAIDARGSSVAINEVTNRIYVVTPSDQSVSTLTIVDGSTHVASAVATAQYPRDVVVNPVTNRIYVAAGGDGNLTPTVSVFDGNSLARTDVALGAYASANACCSLSLNSATNKIYAVTSASCHICPPGIVAVIDGATNAVSDAGGSAAGAMQDPVTNRFYRWDSTLGPVGSTSYSWSARDASIYVVATPPAGAAAAVASNPATARVYVANQDSNDVTILDGGTNSVVGTVPVGTAPKAIAVNARTNRTYVANSGSATVTVIDGAGGTATIGTGTTPSALAVNPVTGRVYVANTGSNDVTVIDGASGTTMTVAAGTAPAAVALDTVRNRVFVANGGSNNVTIIDGATHATTVAPVGTNPVAMAVNSTTGYAYVANQGSSTLSVIGPAGTVVALLPMGAAPYGVAVSETSNQAFVVLGSSSDTGNVKVIDGASNTVQSTVDAGLAGPSIIADPASDRVYVGRADGNIGVFRSVPLASRVTAATIPAAISAPRQLVVDPVTGKLYAVGAGGVRIVTPATREPVPPFTTIAPLAGNATASRTPKFTFTATPGLANRPVQAVYFSVDSLQGPWIKAEGAGPYTGRPGTLTPGTHVLHAFAADSHISGFVANAGTTLAGRIAASVFTVTDECARATCTDLSVSHVSVPGAGFTGKDAVIKLAASNGGPTAATDVILTEVLPADAQFVWASPGCAPSGNTVACSLGTMASGATRQVTVVLRPASPGTATLTATIDAAEIDPQLEDNQSIATMPVSVPPVANAVLRYRLYSPVTLEHHFTTDLNEYTVLGAQGGWEQEGTVGKVLDNPGSFNGVTATPYYRLYNDFNHWHHWTTDPNEYYTLLTFPGWNGEGVDGWILPTNTTGAMQLYRLVYPNGTGLHHWTVDANEYTTLIATYGWVGEGGAGFVIQ